MRMIHLVRTQNIIVMVILEVQGQMLLLVERMVVGPLRLKISDILYYEVLDIPLPELQWLKTLKVALHHARKDEAIILNIRLPKQSVVGDVLNEIKMKVELSHPC